MRRRAQKPPLNADGHIAHCYWCKRQLMSSTSSSQLAATRDHVVPESEGGRKTVWACFACNNLKGAMMPREWRRFMEMNPDWWRDNSRKPGARTNLRDWA